MPLTTSGRRRPSRTLRRKSPRKKKALQHLSNPATTSRSGLFDTNLARLETMLEHALGSAACSMNQECQQDRELVWEKIESVVALSVTDKEDSDQEAPCQHPAKVQEDDVRVKSSSTEKNCEDEATPSTSDSDLKNDCSSVGSQEIQNQEANKVTPVECADSISTKRSPGDRTVMDTNELEELYRLQYLKRNRTRSHQRSKPAQRHASDLSTSGQIQPREDSRRCPPRGQTRTKQVVREKKARTTTQFAQMDPPSDDNRAMEASRGTDSSGAASSGPENDGDDTMGALVPLYDAQRCVMTLREVQDLWKAHRRPPSSSSPPRATTGGNKCGDRKNKKKKKKLVPLKEVQNCLMTVRQIEELWREHRPTKKKRSKIDPTSSGAVRGAAPDEQLGEPKATSTNVGGPRSAESSNADVLVEAVLGSLEGHAWKEEQRCYGEEADLETATVHETTDQDTTDQDTTDQDTTDQETTDQETTDQETTDQDTTTEADDQDEEDTIDSMAVANKDSTCARVQEMMDLINDTRDMLESIRHAKRERSSRRPPGKYNRAKQSFNRRLQETGGGTTEKWNDEGNGISSNTYPTLIVVEDGNNYGHQEEDSSSNNTWAHSRSIGGTHKPDNRGSVRTPLETEDFEEEYKQVPMVTRSCETLPAFIDTDRDDDFGKHSCMATRSCESLPAFNDANDTNKPSSGGRSSGRVRLPTPNRAWSSVQCRDRIPRAPQQRRDFDEAP